MYKVNWHVEDKAQNREELRVRVGVRRCETTILHAENEIMLSIAQMETTIERHREILPTMSRNFRLR